MMDMTAVIVPKSDQLNSDDLIPGPRTIRIRDVEVRPGTEQPVSIFFDGDNGKPWKPCKSMSRVLVSAWGPDAKAYIGRSATLFRDPSVTWGGMAVGGIRVSHMSHIDREFSIALTATKKSRAITKVLPLAADVMPMHTLDDARDAVNAAMTLDELRAAWGQKWMRPHREALAGLLEERKADLTPAIEGEGRDDRDMGEAHNGAEADILAHLAKKVRVQDVDSLLQSRIAELDEEGQERLRHSAAARIAGIKGGANG